MSIQNTFSYGTIAILLVAGLTLSAPAHSSDAGAFVGGMLASNVLGNMRRRTQAEEYQAYSKPSTAQPVQQAAPAPAAPAPAAQTTQQKLDQLNKLAAGGYITPQEYKAKKQAIIDSM